MDESPNISPQKTSPLIIKLCCASSSKQPDISPEPATDPQSITSPQKKPVAVQMKPVALTFCRLSKDGALSKTPEPLKISTALSLKLGAALRERIPLKCLPSQKVTVDTKSDESNEAERQSLTSHSSKLADDRLDFVDGGDKSQVLQLSQPPLTMQPSNLHTDDLLDAKYGRGGSKTSVVQGSSTLSPVTSCSITSTKCATKHLASNETEMEPASKKIKLSDTILDASGSECESLIGVTTGNICTKKPKIIKFENSPSGKQIFAEPSVCVLEKGNDGFIIARSQQILPPTLLPSSVEKLKGIGDKLELANVIDNEKSVVVRTEHPISSSSSGFDDKKESKAENLQTCFPEKSKYSGINQGSIKGDPVSPPVGQIDVNVDKAKEMKSVSLFDYSHDSLNAVENQVNDTLLSHKETCVIDQNLKLNPETACPFNQSIEKSSDFSLKNSNDIFVGFDQVDGLNIDKNKSSKIEDKSMTRSGSPSNQNVKVCPFKRKFESRFMAEIDQSNKTKFKSDEVLKNDFIQPQSAKGDISCNLNDIIDMNSKEPVVESKNVLMKSINNFEVNQSKAFLGESSKSNSQSESVVNYDGEMENKDVNSKETELEAQDGDFSDGEGNELLGISSDESNQMESQNGIKEPEMEFDILDEFESNDNDPEPEVRTSDSESEISADEIDAMLEAGLGDYGKPNPENLHEVREKVLLKVRGKDHFEILPEGWIEVTHNSGIPIYLHKQTRVCCVSKPYFLGPGSTRKHEIPISAIPCLHYMKELEKEKLQAENKLNGIEEDLENKNKNSSEVNGNDIDNDKDKNHATENGCANTELVDASKVAEKNFKVPVEKASNVPKGSNLIFPSAKLECVKEVKVSGSLDYLAVREYCQKRFEFETIAVKRFRTWCGRRKHQKLLKRKQRPFLPDSTQLITCPLYSNTDKLAIANSGTKREFIMNPVGKSPVCILHEYVQHTLRVQPKYIFKELESASTPYGAVVIINDMEYGSGYGSSKKVAKSEAAKSALEVLIPKIRKFDPEKRGANEDDYPDVEFFDEVRVEDPRISDLSVKAGQPFPYQILLECLKRNYGMGDTEISIKMKNIKHQKNEFLMKVGKHKATVVCKNKRDGKHRASQAILQQLHPHINSWGSLLRMYGKGSCKTLKEKKEEEQRITELQSKACVNKPNISILNKLKEEMMKYREKMKSKKPIGKLIPERMQLFSISDSNLKSIEL